MPNNTRQSQTNKQGRSGEINEEDKKKILDTMQHDSTQCYQSYRNFLDIGLTRELARNNLTFNIYTQWYWKIDLHNLMHFLRLRCDKHAQYEIRQYANVIANILKKWMPITYEAFIDYCMKGAFLSGPALDIIRDKIIGKNTDRTKLSNRELEELEEIIQELKD